MLYKTSLDTHWVTEKIQTSFIYKFYDAEIKVQAIIVFKEKVIYLFIYLFIYLSTYLFIYLSIYLFIYLFIIFRWQSALYTIQKEIYSHLYQNGKTKFNIN